MNSNHHNGTPDATYTTMNKLSAEELENHTRLHRGQLDFHNCSSNILYDINALVVPSLLSHIAAIEAERDDALTAMRTASEDATTHKIKAQTLERNWHASGQVIAARDETITQLRAENELLRKSIVGIFENFTPQHLDHVSGTQCGSNAHKALATPTEGKEITGTVGEMCS